MGWESTMTVHAKHRAKPALEQFEDEFGPYIEHAKQDPVFRAAYEDAEALHRLLDDLVALRKALGLSQKAVADRMNVRQPTVSGFETEGSDPRLSTLQRYARAVEARLRLVIEMPAHCDWVTPSTSAYQNRGQATGAVRSSVTRGDLAKAWSRQDDRRDDWVLTA
jgi:transcriptional regulator with XRE-family HTH domain